MHNALFDSRNLRYFSAFILLMFAMMAGATPPVSAQYNDLSSAASEVDGADSLRLISLSGELRSRRMSGKRFLDGMALREFYSKRENKSMWVGRKKLTPDGRSLVSVLENSWTHGLNPESYHLEKIQKLLLSKRGSSKVTLELLLSDGFVRYGRDLSGMRVDGTKIKLNLDDWRSLKSPSEVLTVLSEKRRLSRALKALEPQGKTYKKLRQDLISIVGETSGEGKEHLPVEFGGLMKPGWGHKGVLALRARLDVPRPLKGSRTYDDKLAKAVMVFQEENGLNADGVIGEKTLQLLNRTRKDKMLQLVANMERLRWVKPEGEERHVVVNIPSATLWAYGDNKKLAFEMPVIVGSPWRRTRSFATEIRGVRLNPTWTIPATIKRYDILPKIQEDVAYLEEKNIALWRGYGRDAERVSPSSVNWEKLPLRDLHDIRMVMAPGEINPLGRVRILMPNNYNMYLHDTNHPELFAKADRTLSSGCIRLKEPEKMARYVMNGQSDWDASQMNDVFDEGSKVDYKIKDRIPVTVMYHTVWLDEREEVVYGSDVYNYDPVLIALLDEQNAYRLPGLEVVTDVKEQKVAALRYN